MVDLPTGQRGGLITPLNEWWQMDDQTCTLDENQQMEENPTTGEEGNLLRELV